MAAPTAGEANAPANGETTGAGGASVAAPAESLMAWGSTHVHLRASYQVLYSTGINNQPGQSSDTFTHTITPELTVIAGPHVTLVYAPSYRIFSDRQFHDTLDHYLNLSASARLGSWTFGTSHALTITDEPEIQTARQTSETSYFAGANASYQASDKLSFVTSGSANFLWTDTGNNNSSRTNSPIPIGPPPGFNFTNLNDSATYSGSESINYSFDERISVGGVVTVGYTEQSGGFNSMNEIYTGLAEWRPGSKLKLSVSGGFEDQQFLNTDAKDLLSPIFSASAAYQIFEQTSFNLSAGRTVMPSLLQNEVMETTQLGVGVQQRLLGFMQLSLAFGYHTTDYKFVLNNLSNSRSDSGAIYTADLSFPFLTHGNFGLFYQYSQNSSSVKGFGYSSSQVGANLSWAY